MKVDTVILRAFLQGINLGNRIDLFVFFDLTKILVKLKLVSYIWLKLVI